MAYNKIATRYTYYTRSRTSTPNNTGDMRAWGTAYYEQTESDKANNQSKVKLVAGIYATNVVGTVYGNFKINANIYKNVSGSWVQIGTGSYTATNMNMSNGNTTLITISDKIVPHDNSGEGSFKVSVSISNVVFTIASVTVNGSNQSYSYTYSLPKIEEQAYITNVDTLELNQTLIGYGIGNNEYVNQLSQKKYTITIDNPNQYVVSSYNAINGSITGTSQNNEVTLDFTDKDIATQTTDGGIVRPLVMVEVQFDNSSKISTYAGYDTNTIINYQTPQFVKTATTTKRNGQLSGKVTLNAQGTYYNGSVGTLNQGGSYKPTIKYKFWKTNDTEPLTYDYIVPAAYININDGTFSISNYEIGSDDPIDINYFDFNYSYNVQLEVSDSFGANITICNVVQGVPVWTEYANRVDFKKIVAGNIDGGTDTLGYQSTGTQINFHKTFTNPPNVVITPVTTVSGAIAPKIKQITTTYFVAYHSGSQDVDCCWIAIEN